MRKLSDFLVLNEVNNSRRLRLPETIYLFASHKAAEGYLEPWYADESYLLLSGDGKRKTIQPSGSRIRIGRSQDTKNYSKTVRLFLIRHLRSLEQTIIKKRSLNIGEIKFDKLSTHDLFKIALLLN